MEVTAVHPPESWSPAERVECLLSSKGPPYPQFMDEVPENLKRREPCPKAYSC